MKANTRSGQLQVQALRLLNALVTVQRSARSHALNNAAMLAPMEGLRAQLTEVIISQNVCEFFLYETVCVLNGVMATPDLAALGLVREVTSVLNSRHVGGFRIAGPVTLEHCQALTDALVSGRVGMDPRYGFEVANVAVIMQVLHRLHEQEVATITNRDLMTVGLSVYSAMLSIIQRSAATMRNAGEAREVVSTSRVLREAVDACVAAPGIMQQLALLRDTRIQYLQRHLVGTTLTSVLVGLEMSLTRAELIHLARVALFHELGMTVYGEHLEQTRDLSPADRQLVREMPLLSARSYLKRRGLDFETLRAVVAAVECKRGFNEPLTQGGPQQVLPLTTMSARIVQVCSAFDAMTSDRPFRPALPIIGAIDALGSSSARYDPRVLIALMRVLAGVRRGGGEQGNSGFAPRLG